LPTLEREPHHQRLNAYAANDLGEIVLHRSLNSNEIKSISTNATVLFDSTIDSKTLLALKHKGCSFICTGILARIGSKYQEGKAYELPLPFEETPNVFPAPFYTVINHTQVKTQLQRQSVQPPLRDFFSESSSVIFESQESPGNYRFIGFSKIDKNDKFIFIMAGRKEEAFTPKPDPNNDQYRTVLVLTEAEYQALKENKSSLKPYEVLIVSPRINTLTESQPGMITARRRATLIFALINALKNLMMLDDNITKVEIGGHHQQSNQNHYVTLYDLMLAQTVEANEPLASLQTKSRKQWHLPTMLGCKYFFFNLDIFRSMLETLDKDIDPTEIGFSIFPEDDATGQQDYYMQLYFHALAALIKNENNKQHGFYICPKRMAQIYRSQINRNLALAKNKRLSEIHITKDLLEQVIDAGGRTLLEVVDRTVYMYNSIVSEGIKRHKEKQDDFFRANYRESLSPGEEDSFSEDENTLLPLPLEDYLDKTVTINDLYPHQRSALSFYKDQLHSKSDINFTMCTGSGKTYIQALIAFSHFKAEPGKNVVIICPTQHISIQFRDALRALTHKEWLPEELKVSPNKINSVLSDPTTQSISQDHFHWNESLQEEANILVICHQSFKQLLSNQNAKCYKKPFDLIGRTSVFLFDEAHLTSKYDPQAIRSSEALLPAIRRLNFTATSIHDGGLQYEFSTKAGLKGQILAPFVVDNTFPAGDIRNWDKIASFITDHVMPNNGAEKLEKYKGIIYVDSIEDANALFSKMRNNSVVCFKINSSEADSNANIHQFKEVDTGIAIAVDMLVEGFDCPDVHWAMILKESLSGQNDFNKTILDAQRREQILGRLLRIPATGEHKTALLIVPDSFRLSKLENDFCHSKLSLNRKITSVVDTMYPLPPIRKKNKNAFFGDTSPSSLVGHKRIREEANSSAQNVNRP
jgi:superfamily II DNA or RNA helicase